MTPRLPPRPTSLFAVAVWTAAGSVCAWLGLERPAAGQTGVMPSPYGNRVANPAPGDGPSLYAPTAPSSTGRPQGWPGGQPAAAPRGNRYGSLPYPSTATPQAVSAPPGPYPSTATPQAVSPPPRPPTGAAASSPTGPRYANHPAYANGSGYANGPRYENGPGMPPRAAAGPAPYHGPVANQATQPTAGPGPQFPVAAGGNAPPGPAGPANRPQAGGAAPRGVMGEPFARSAPAGAQFQTPGVDIYHIDSATIVATVGPHAILAGDVLTYVNDVLQTNKDKIPPDKLDEIRRKLIEQRLKNLVDQKVMFVEAERNIDPQMMPTVKEQMNKEFEKSQLKTLMDKLDADSFVELDTQLREMGSSVQRQREQYVERSIATVWMQQNLDFDEDVSHEELLEYYREHIEEYKYPAKTRWKQLVVNFGAERTEREAFQKIAWMGNQILQGAPFEEIARRHSDGPTAQDGGARDWTEKDALVSKQLDEAIFHQPVGRMGKILKENGSFQIVLVTERKPAGREPFVDAQGEIKKKILEERRKKQVEEYIARVKDKTPVSTIFDDPALAEEFLSRIEESSRVR